MATFLCGNSVTALVHMQSWFTAFNTDVLGHVRALDVLEAERDAHGGSVWEEFVLVGVVCVSVCG